MRAASRSRSCAWWEDIAGERERTLVDRRWGKPRQRNTLGTGGDEEALTRQVSQSQAGFAKKRTINDTTQQLCTSRSVEKRRKISSRDEMRIGKGAGDRY